MLVPPKKRPPADPPDFADETDDLPESTDALLLDAWNRHRDGEAFSALVSRYSPLVFGVCRRQCGNQQDAEDAFQATFLALSRDSTRIRNIASLPGWLYRIAVRSSSRARSRSEQPTEPLMEDPMDPGDKLDEIANRHRLRTLDEELSQLPRKYRDVIVLHHLEGFTCHQTAERLGCSEPMIRGRLQRGRRLLRRLLCRRGISLSLTFAAFQTARPMESAKADLVNRAIETATTSSPTTADTSTLEPLLAKESILMSSTTTAVSVIAVSTFVLVGITFAQTGASSPREGAPGKLIVAANEQAVGDGTVFGDSLSSQFTPIRSTGDKPGETSNWVGSNGDRIAAIESSLQKETSADFTDTPLTECMKQISATFDLPIVIDKKALEEIGLTDDIPVSLTLKNLSLESELNLICRDLDLTYTIDNDVLEITTKEAAEERLLTRIYWSGETGLQADDSAAHLIQTSVEPNAWEQLGGTSTVSVFGSKATETSGLVVSTTYRIHRKIEQLLDAIALGSSSKVSGTSIH